MTDLAALSARALAKAIRDKKVSSVEATKRAIEQLKACHELTNCIITLEADEALAAAKAADAAIAAGTRQGPLAGVPLAHKDMFDRKGKIASWGARIRADKPATRGRHRHRPLQGGRRPAGRRPAPDRVRLRPDGPQLRAGPRAQSLGPDAHHRRLLGRHRRLRRLRRDPRRPRLRHRRLAAPAGGRAAASPPSSRPGAASAAPAPCRWRPRSIPIGVHRPARRGSGPDAGPAGRPRSARSRRQQRCRCPTTSPASTIPCRACASASTRP